MSFDTLLIDSCLVERYTTGVQDAYGEPARTWADHLTDEPCRLTPGSRPIGSASQAGVEHRTGAEVVVADYTLFIGDVDVTEQDRVTVDSVLYEILMVATRQNGVGNHHRELFLKAVR